jgi:hypothetical protein
MHALIMVLARDDGGYIDEGLSEGLTAFLRLCWRAEEGGDRVRVLNGSLLVAIDDLKLDDGGLRRGGHGW